MLVTLAKLLDTARNGKLNRAHCTYPTRSFTFVPSYYLNTTIVSLRITQGCQHIFLETWIAWRGAHK